MGWDSTVSAAGWSRDRIPMGVRFSVPVQTGLVTYPAFYTVGTGSFPGVKRPGHGYASTSGVGLCGLLQGELDLYLSFLVMDTMTLCLCVFAGTLGLDLLFCFSARQNMRYLNKKLSSEIDIVSSVKFILSCLIILDHTGGLTGAAPLWNLEQLESVSQSVDESHQGP
jgi:hypothetical protein